VARTVMVAGTAGRRRGGWMAPSRPQQGAWTTRRISRWIRCLTGARAAFQPWGPSRRAGEAVDGQETHRAAAQRHIMDSRASNQGGEVEDGQGRAIMGQSTAREQETWIVRVT
jgi:hypothetical protein